MLGPKYKNINLTMTVFLKEVHIQPMMLLILGPSRSGKSSKCIMNCLIHLQMFTVSHFFTG